MTDTNKELFKKDGNVIWDEFLIIEKINYNNTN